MALTKESVGNLLQLVEQTYDGWTGFDDPRFLENEIGYKQAASQLMQERLGREQFSELIEREDWDEIKKRLLAVGSKTNLLFRGVPKSGDLGLLHIDGVDPAQFSKEFFKLLYGEGETEDRVNTYAGFLAANQLPSKWTLPTYYLFLAHPESEIFIKPKVMSWFLKFAGSPTKLGSKPTAEIYKECKELFVRLRELLPLELTPETFIDLQSLVFSARIKSEPSKQAAKKTQNVTVWKIAPGENADWWDIWDEYEVAAVGFNNTGDLSDLKTNSEFKDFRSDYNSEHPDNKIKQGASQAWKFAHQVKIGDLIVANKGKDEILGIGTVVGDYRYVPDEDYVHQRDIDWFAFDGCEIVRQENWQRTLLKLPSSFLEEHVAEFDKPLFSQKSFELLEELSEKPLKATYEAKNGEYTEFVREPVKKLLEAVIKRLPESIFDAMKTDTGLYSRLGKNDFGQGGAWDFYWGAIYDPAHKRTQSVQLFVFLEKNKLRIGFSCGARVDPSYPKTIRANLQKDQDKIRCLLIESLSQENLRFELNDRVVEFDEWFLQATEGNVGDVKLRLDADYVLGLTRSELVSLTLRTFENLFPLVILTTKDNAVTELTEYLEIETTAVTGINPVYSLEDVEEATGFSIEDLDLWTTALDRKKQVVFYGPPGTGKTYVAQELATYLLSGGDGIQELVQFHPAYEYEDFMIGIRPSTTEEGGLTYNEVPGRFVDFCRRASERAGVSVLIVDEINRANLSRVFGELMYLLEYRDAEIPLAGGNKLKIPKNVRIIGTMNTADRSIALVDHALRRRFAFLELWPNYDALAAWHEETDFDIGPLISLLKQVNKQINDRNYEIGISFFIDKDLTENLESIWRLEIEPYLNEYFFDRLESIEQFRWENIADRFAI